MRMLLATLLAIAVGLALVSLSIGQEPGWTSRIIVPSSEEAIRQATPIVERPYRPLHFYGNTVRRMHYHGRVRPSVTEIRDGFRAWSSRS